MNTVYKNKLRVLHTYACWYIPREVTYVIYKHIHRYTVQTSPAAKSVYKCCVYYMNYMNGMHICILQCIIIIICIFVILYSIDSMYMHYCILYVRESTSCSLTESIRMENLQFDGREGCGECWDADFSCG